jgi:glucosamine--fructose-6-phosphate aminotransferase (isomerizing)
MGQCRRARYKPVAKSAPEQIRQGFERFHPFLDLHPALAATGQLVLDRSYSDEKDRQVDAAVTRMFAEAAETPEMVRRQALDAAAYDQLARRLCDLDPPLAFTCARGSSDHAATFAKHLFEIHLRIPVVSQAPSNVSVYDDRLVRARNTLFLLISQSGRSPDLLLSAEAARRAGALVVGLVNDESSPLVGLADGVLPLRAGPETSVAATKSFVGALSAATRLTAAWSGDDLLASALVHLPDHLAAAWDCDWSDALPDVVSAQQMLVLGRGPTLGIAQEAALKFKETCGLHAEAFSIAEVVHGPMELVHEGFPILVFAPEERAAIGLSDLLARFAQRGARIWVAGSESHGQRHLPVVPSLHPTLAPIAMALSFYRLVEQVARLRGRDPDRPVMLSKVTRTT